MTQQIIDTGAVPNDGSGDPLRQAFDKINNNFANLFALAPTASVENMLGLFDILAKFKK